jgi:biotin-dependent carboxylase-like uncharacterized protein
MTAVLTLDSVGPGATIQDAGRFGLLRYGVTPAGPMDWTAHETANRALGNAPGAAAIEIGPGGVALSVDRPVTLAVAGGGFLWTRDETRLPSAVRIVLRPGERLRARAGAWGTFAICAVSGGIASDPVMGSRATHTRSGLGGLDGRHLRTGDRLSPAQDGPAMDDRVIAAPWLAASDSPIRIVLGPQDDHFSPRTIADFLATPYVLTTAADRMAYTFDGPVIAHARDFNIVSDGVALGAIQVAGDGRPLILMADRQPTGGYPKIGHVCRADIGRLSQVRPGESVRFQAVTAAAARTALLALEDRIEQTPAHLVPLLRAPTAAALLAANLIDGVTDGSDDSR